MSTFAPPVPSATQTNAAAVDAWLEQALSQLATLQTQAATLLPASTADYATANLANLNDLLHKLQQVVGGPNRDGTGGLLEIITGLRTIVRHLIGDYSGSN